MKIHLSHHYIFIFLLVCCYCVFFAIGGGGVGVNGRAQTVWCPNQLVRRRLLGSHPLDLPSKNLLLSTDASALLAFKSKADLGNKLDFSSRTSLAFCKWQGVECSQAKVVRFVVENLNLSGIFASDTLNRLDQLRVLSLQNNSLTGPIPDLSGLANLKVLFLDHNYFSGSVPPSISTLHRLKTLDLSYNSLTGPIPVSLNNLDRLYYLRLDFNRFNGSVPPLNQTMLQIFNVSHNNLSGPIPITQTLSRFKTASFLNNPGLCGEIIHKECNTIQPFFGPPTPAVTPPPKPAVLGQNAQSQHELDLNQTRRNDHKRTALIIGLSSSMFILIGSLLCFALISRKFKKHSQDSKASTPRMVFNTAAATADAEAVMRIEEDNYELEEKVKRVQEGMHAMGKSGSLVFCAGEAHVYTLEQLMRASAELLGRGTMGTTYKAVLDNRLIVCVKRLDAGRFAGASNDVFDQHMGSVGGLRHPNLVPLRAYFQAKEERLLVYDYQPNGSLFSLIHGSKSTRSKPLHWTSCLKIAEDVAKGLSYIHQAWRLVHGNLKSSNVLLGSDFEACVTDYCLPAIASGASIDEDPDATAYKAPEIRKFNTQQATSKSDVYAFGILLLELLTGKHPSQHPYLMNDDMVNWVRLTRDEDSGEDNRFEMLLEVAMTCSVASPEQRPTMWQVLKMIQEIKEAVIMEDS